MKLDIEKVDLSPKKINFNLTKFKIIKFYLKTIMLLLFMQFKISPSLVKKKDEFFFHLPKLFFIWKNKFF